MKPNEDEAFTSFPPDTFIIYGGQESIVNPFSTVKSLNSKQLGMLLP